MSSAHLTATAPRWSWLAAARRTGWLSLGLAALAFGGLEVANHGPWALALLVLFVIAPDEQA